MDQVRGNAEPGNARTVALGGLFRFIISFAALASLVFAAYWSDQ